MNVWYLITLAGEPVLWAIVSLLLVVFYFVMKIKGIEKRKNIKRFLVFFIPSIIAVFLIAQGFKTFVYLERPCVPCPADMCNPYCMPDSSFPSGHTAAAFAVFTSIFIAVGRKKALPVFLIPVLVACSRIALGVHTLPDVLGGFVLGAAIPLIVLGFEKRLGKV